MAADKRDVGKEGAWLLPGEGRQISIGPNRITYLLEGHQTGGRFSLIHYEVGPSFVAPTALHYHTREDWSGYVVEGTLGFQLGERTVILTAGSSLRIPKGLPFKWWNNEDKPARFLAYYFPAGFEQYFADLEEAIKDFPPGPLDMAKAMPRLVPLWDKYGIGTVRSEDK
ncbi:MAG TPA: cupin domain-containing protein [Pyrinomonadaceae bacterium]|jgi:mannose-6-phosphate isomerase-like protein (cupin superfamily)